MSSTKHSFKLDLQRIEEEEKQKATKSSQSQKSKRTLFFSKLPLSLKKQFLYYLTKNEVEFLKNSDGRFMEAMIEIQDGDGKNSKKRNKKKIEDFLERNGLLNIQGKNDDPNSKGKNDKNVHRKNCYHKKCKMDEFDLHRKREKRKRTRSREEKKIKDEENPNNFYFDPETGKWVRICTYQEMKENMRAFPNQMVDLKKLKKKKFLEKMIRKPSRDHSVEDIEWIINENDMNDKEYYYQTLGKRLSYAKQSKVRSESLFVDYLDKENIEIINGKKRNFRRKNINLKDRNKNFKGRKKSPFSSVYKTPKKNEDHERRNSRGYTPSINLSKIDFSPLDQRLVEREKEFEESKILESKEMEGRLLKELAKENIKRRRKSIGKEKSGRGYQLMSLKPNEITEKKEKADIEFSSVKANHSPRRRRKRNYEIKKEKVFDPDQFETEDLRDIEEEKLKQKIKKSRNSKSRYSLATDSPLELDLIAQTDGVLSTQGNGYLTDKLESTPRKFLQNKVVVKREGLEDIGEGSFENEHPSVDGDMISQRVYREGEEFDEEEEEGMTEKIRYRTENENFESKDYRTPPILMTYGSSTVQKKDRKSLDQQSEHINSFVNISGQSTHSIQNKSKKEKKWNVNQYYQANPTSESDQSNNPKKADLTRSKLSNTFKNSSILKTKDLMNNNTLEHQLSKMYNRNRLVGTTKDSVDSADFMSSVRHDYLLQTQTLMTLTPNRKKRCMKRRFQIPNNMERRIKERKNRSRTPKKRRKSKTPTKKTPTRLYNFKRSLDRGEMTNIKIGLDLLHTDELMKYYKEVVSKSKMDYVAHHRQQNMIKRLEYNYLQDTYN